MNRLQEIEQRLAAIRTECMNEGADLDALTNEANSLVEERRALLNQQNDSAERRRALLAAIANGTAGAGNVAPGAAPESRHAYTNASPEYRDAFFAYISGRNMSAEQSPPTRVAWMAEQLLALCRHYESLSRSNGCRLLD